MAWDVLVASLAGGGLALTGGAIQAEYNRKAEQRQRIQEQLTSIMAWTAAAENYKNLLRLLTEPHQEPVENQLTARATKEKHRAEALWDTAQVNLVWLGTGRHAIGNKIGLTAWQVYPLVEIIGPMVEARLAHRDKQLKSMVDLDRVLKQTFTGIEKGLVVLRAQIQEYWTEVDESSPIPSLRRWRRRRQRKRTLSDAP